MSTYLCLSCLLVSKPKELNEGKCPRCDNDHLMKTYNASDSVDIPDVNFYK